MAAATILLDKLGKSGRRIPIDVEGLARAVGAKVQILDHVSEGAQLLPVPNGFVILVDASLQEKSPRRYRRAVVHEIVHTLFYVNGPGQSKRMFPSEERGLRLLEEQFASDTARRILVPDWALEERGIMSDRNMDRAFRSIQDEFHVSQDVAAGVLIQDHYLFQGVAGRLTKVGTHWTKDTRNERFFASPTLTAAQRKLLWSSAIARLEASPGSVSEPSLVVEVHEPKAFVMIEQPTTPGFDREKAHLAAGGSFSQVPLSRF